MANMEPGRKRTCFVVMPFGEKVDVDGEPIDFDDIYRYFFKLAIEDLGIECIRCDEIEEAGAIHDKMFEHIYQSDVVAVDITTSNANVYYELGIRHALAKGVTLLIRRKGTTIPFNIQGQQVVEYDQGRFASIERAKSRIRQIIKNGLDQKLSDSPVHTVLDLNIEPEGKPIGETKVYEYELSGNSGKVVGVITGDVQNITRGVDVWVNAENTNMQMARPFENSISGVIRYHGMEKDGGEAEDTIALALAQEMAGRVSVDPAEVLVTTSGALKRTHRVKRIFHVAANVGQAGKGYTPIADVPRCVDNVLGVDPHKAKVSSPDELRSILIPLMGTRPRRGTVHEALVQPLLNAAIDHLGRNPDCMFKKVYFLNYTDKEFDVCQSLLRADPRLKPRGTGHLPAADPVAEPSVTQSPASGPPIGGSGNGSTIPEDHPAPSTPQQETAGATEGPATANRSSRKKPRPS